MTGMPVSYSATEYRNGRGQDRWKRERFPGRGGPVMES